MGWPPPCGIRGPCLDQRVCSVIGLTRRDDWRSLFCSITELPQTKVEAERTDPEAGGKDEAAGVFFLIWFTGMDLTETTRKSSLKLGYMDELSPEWCTKPVYLVFYVKNITHLYILCLIYAMLTLLSRVVYISQPCRLHNSVIPQTYLKIRKCLDNSAVSFR
ncbi:BnaC03g61790D [Brassica napus]|uniref:(rape) hypothetical protein n=1 Tax=Brassica napus TaxID=3708 RepID=A0A078GAR2_BRANA|nr:unnamed protein product [Brassica napus]CDY22466.1 BnaC03g61790D [Brassica napus]